MQRYTFFSHPNSDVVGEGWLFFPGLVYTVSPVFRLWQPRGRLSIIECPSASRAQASLVARGFVTVQYLHPHLMWCFLRWGSGKDRTVYVFSNRICCLAVFVRGILTFCRLLLFWWFIFKFSAVLCTIKEWWVNRRVHYGIYQLTLGKKVWISELLMRGLM